MEIWLPMVMICWLASGAMTCDPLNLQRQTNLNQADCATQLRRMVENYKESNKLQPGEWILRGACFQELIYEPLVIEDNNHGRGLPS